MVRAGGAANRRQRVVIFGVARNPRYPNAEPVPYTVLINPIITPLSEDLEEGWEGCRACRNARCSATLYPAALSGYDQFGVPIDRCGGLLARAVQHEYDHLDGILYPMRIRDMRNFGFHDVIFPDQPDADE
jgi:peptide deformylase